MQRYIRKLRLGWKMKNKRLWHYLTERQLALRFNMSEKTLQNWRAEGRGPAWSKFETLVRYKISDVRAYERRCKIEGANR